MRDIKFRAWDEDLQKMFYSEKTEFYIGANGCCAVNKQWQNELIAGGFVKDGFHKRKILMEFTGRRDKSKNDIYEGDGVKTGNGRIWDVRMGEYKYIGDSYSSYGWYLEGGNCQYPLINCEKLEVVGHIHQN